MRFFHLLFTATILSMSGTSLAHWHGRLEEFKTEEIVFIRTLRILDFDQHSQCIAAYTCSNTHHRCPSINGDISLSDFKGKAWQACRHTGCHGPGNRHCRIAEFDAQRVFESEGTVEFLVHHGEDRYGREFYYHDEDDADDDDQKGDESQRPCAWILCQDCDHVPRSDMDPLTDSLAHALHIHEGSFRRIHEEYCDRVRI